MRFADNFYEKIDLFSEVLEKIQNEIISDLDVKNDSIIFERYWNDYSADSASNSFSISLPSFILPLALTLSYRDISLTRSFNDSLALIK